MKVEPDSLREVDRDVDQTLVEMLGELQIHCVNPPKDEGKGLPRCPWTGPRSNLDEHLKKCKFADIATIKKLDRQFKFHEAIEENKTLKEELITRDREIQRLRAQVGEDRVFWFGYVALALFVLCVALIVTLRPRITWE